MPPPIPTIPADPTIGYPGYAGYSAPPFETNEYSTNESCQEALNAEINALTQEISNVPSATTEGQFQASTAAINEIQAEVMALGDLRPACMRLPSGPSDVEPAGNGSLRAHRGGSPKTPLDNGDLRLRFACPGYSACTVLVTTVVHAIGKFARILGGTAANSRSIVIGRGSFSLTAGKSPELRMAISSNGRKLLRRLHQIKVRIVTTAIYVGDHVRVASQQVRTLKADSSR